VLISSLEFCFIIANAFLFMQISPASTLESSFEALNVKKFDGKFKAYSHYSSVENYSAMGLKCHAYY
jgi:hypothetical protein